MDDSENICWRSIKSTYKHNFLGLHAELMLKDAIHHLSLSAADAR